MKALGE
jgi:hypothetical protein